MYQVDVSARGVDGFVELVGHERVLALKGRAEHLKGRLGPRVVWNISSTPSGGGVAEMLRSLLRYARGLGIDVRWLVLEGSPEFFRITKRIHNALHESSGDGSPLGPEQVEVYERTTKDNLASLDTFVKPGDVVICHDPQTAGLVPHLASRRVPVIWRCHIGHERHGVEVDRGWGFLSKYIRDVPFAVFSRAEYAPTWLRHKRSVVLPPNIDPFSAKNQPIAEVNVRAILGHIGLVDDGGAGEPTFALEDGGVGRVGRRAEVVRLGPPPPWETPLVVQVSRWDRMKDPIGVLRGFARLGEADRRRGAHLVLAGPSVRGVDDDPEGPGVWEEVAREWGALPEPLRRAVHLVQLPMNDNDENAAMVNALQRHAAVILQKSLVEGFGLTVAEAMWKRRPVVASAVGGIQDQIRDGIDGLLIRDPRDPEELAGALARVLGDEALARRLGDAAYERVREKFLSIASLEHWAALMESLVAEEALRAH